MWGSGYDHYGSYRIDAQFVPVTQPADPEPNDSVKHAAPMMLNRVNTGNLGCRRDGHWDDIDWWKITITEDGRLTLADSTEPTMEYYLRLFDADGVTLIRSEYRKADNTGNHIAVNLAPGTYYFQLDMWGSGYDHYGSYRIATQFVPVSLPGDPEPNDSLHQAVVMKPDQVVTGNLGSRRDGLWDDIDWWKITLEKDGLLTLTDSTEAPLEYYLRLYGQDGTTTLTSVFRFKDNTGKKLSRKLTHGTYYVQVDRFGGDYYVYGSYLLRPHLLPAPTASFEVSQDIRTFSFRNLTTGAESYAWDFGDDTGSDQVNPVHTYAGPGEYLVRLVAENAAGTDTAFYPVTIFGVSEVLPRTIGNKGEVTLTLLGGGFGEDVGVMLTRDGTDGIAATTTTYYERGAVRATFNLQEIALGPWDVTVDVPGRETIIREEAVTVVEAGEPKPWVSLSGRSRALFNRWQTYTLTYGNTGNVDADIVPVWILLSDPGENLLEFEELDVRYPEYVTDNSLEARFDSIKWYYDIDTLWGEPQPTRVYPLYIPKIPAGYTGYLKFRIKTGSRVNIQVWNNPPLMENGTLKTLCSSTGASTLGQCIEQAKTRALRDLALTYIGLIPGGGCITSLTKEFFAIRDMRMESYTKRRSWSSFAYAMTSLFLGCVADFVPITELYKLAIAVTSTIQYLHDGIYDADRKCHEKFGMNSHRNKTIRGVNSFDPNEISGPPGYGPANYTAPLRTAGYTIYFENKDTASAPAQEIWITDTLDLQKFRPGAFSFQSLTLGDTTIPFLYGQHEFSVDIDYRPARQLIGRVTGRVDTVTGVVSIYMTSLDPLTLQQNEDPTLGILPPNVNAPEGEGSISFSVGVKELTTGETFENSALITFDFNKPIRTNTWRNTVDDEAPQSMVESCMYDEARQEILLNVAGSDDQAGVDYYMVYASVNDSAFVPVLRTPGGSVSLQATAGWNYKFYSVAVDSTGNTEEAPESYDAEVTVTGIRGPHEGSGYHVYPNPASSVLYVEVKGKAQAGARFLELITLDGRRIRQTQMTGTRQSLDITGLEKGLYILRIYGDRFTEMHRVVIR